MQNTPKNKGENKHMATKTSCTVYFLKKADEFSCFLTLSENIGISDTNSNDSIIEDAIITILLAKILAMYSLYKPASIVDATSNVHAGVGIPINDSLWRVSILNFASLNPENTARTKGVTLTINNDNSPDAAPRLP